MSAILVPKVSPREASALGKFTFNPKFQAQPISPKTSSGPFPLRRSGNPIPQERPYQANDVQQATQNVNGKIKTPKAN